LFPLAPEAEIVDFALVEVVDIDVAAVIRFVARENISIRH
jgi:hypothetical protein